MTERELRPRYAKARKEGRGRAEGRDGRAVGRLLIPIAGALRIRLLNGI